MGEGRGFFSLIARVMFLLIPLSFLKFLSTFSFFQSSIKGSKLIPLVQINYRDRWSSLMKNQFFEQLLNSSTLKMRLKFDFYKIDKLLFSPAKVIVSTIKTGKTFTEGSTNIELIEKSFNK